MANWLCGKNTYSKDIIAKVPRTVFIEISKCYKLVLYFQKGAFPAHHRSG